jgi:tetratricopeptide (TPR) repeat protein
MGRFIPFTLSIVFLFCSFSGFAQQKQIDSLNKVLETATGKQRADALCKLARNLGKTDRKKAEEKAAEALQLSQSLNYGSGIAEAYYVEGRIHFVYKEFKEALSSYEKSLEAAKKSGVIRSIGDAYDAVADTYERMNQYDDVIRVCNEAITWAQQSSSKKDEADYQENKGRAYYNKGDYSAAQKHFELAYDIRVLLKDDTGAAGLLMNLGVMTYRAGKIEESLKYYEKSYRTFARMEDTVNMAHALVNKAISLQDLGKTNEAMSIFQRSGELYLAAKDKKNYCYTLLNIAEIYIDRADYSKAQLSVMDAMKTYEYEKDKKGLSICYGYLGQIQRFAGDTAAAMGYYKSGLNITREIKARSSEANMNTNIGNMYSDFKEYVLAEKYYRESYRIRKESGDVRGLADCSISLGNVFYHKQQLDSALSYYQGALDQFLKFGEVGSIAGMYSNIGVVYYEKGDYPKALEYYQKAYDIRKSLQTPTELYDTYLTFSNVYVKLGDYEKAYDYYLKHAALKDSIDKANNRSTLMEVQTKYDSEKKEKEIQLLSKDKALQMAMLTKQQAELLSERLLAESKEKEIDLLNKAQFLKETQLKAAEKEKERQKKELIAVQKERALQDELAAKQKQVTNFFIGGFVLMILVALLIFRSYRQNKKAKEIIAAQKEEVEAKKQEAELQKHLVEEKNKEIVDSIRYAKRLQEAILPPMPMVKEWLPESFVLYKPKDIVAGDFYWVEKVDQSIYFAAADCTGHGVPGAMVSVVGHNGLERCIKEFGLRTPSEILDKLNELVEETFAKGTEEVRDGMDIALCKLSNQNGKITLEYAGANNPLWILNKEGLQEFKADKQPIGRYENRKPFSNNVLELNKGDEVFVFSDGYADQFGGEAGKKYKYSRLKTELLELIGKPMAKKEVVLDENFERWKGNYEQVDDVCVIGVAI